MSKVAFICPLYDMKNHFDLAFNLYQSKVDLKIAEDLYFIFSDKLQAQKFDNRIFLAFNCHVDYLVIDPGLLYLKSKVVVKKLFALRELMHRYEYISIIDSESLFYKKGNFFEIFENIWNSRNCLISNISPDGFFILSKCFKTLGIFDNKKLQKEFGYYRYNFWFNEIQVYKCDTLPDFFNWLDKFDINGWGNEWLCFEYYIYAAYLILEKDFHIKKTKLSSMGGIMEYLYAFSIKKQRKIINTLGTHWSSNPNVTNENTYLLFHLDRDKNTHDYSYNLSLKQIILMYLRMYKNIICEMILH